MSTRSSARTNWNPLGSPYTLSDSIQWVFRYVMPQTGNLNGMSRSPSRRPLDAARTHRIVVFGDLMPPPGGKSPVVDDDLRAFFQSADLALGNLEAPIGSDRVSGNRFQISQDTLSSVLEHLGIDAERCILSIANNHIGDAGLSGARRTVTNLRQMGLGILGRVSKGEGPAVQVRIGPLAIELVAWTQWMNHPLPPDGDQICQQSQALSWLEAPRRDRADLTIALPHWGYEFIHTPRPEDRQLAAHLAARGVNIIAGNHAHVIQPAESLGEAVCFYGLGGLVQGRGAALRWPARLGSILVIDVEADDPRQQTKIPWGYEVIPIVHVHERKEHRIALLRNLPSRETDRMRQRFQAIYPSV